MARNSRVLRWSAGIAIALCMVAPPFPAAAQVDTGAGQTAQRPADASRADGADAPAEPIVVQASAAEPDPTQEALLSAVREIESTAFGQWLREHPVAWNAIAFAATVVLALVLSAVLSRTLRAIVRTTLLRAHKDALAAAIDAGKLYGILGLMPALLLAARALGILGKAELAPAEMAGDLELFMSWVD